MKRAFSLLIHVMAGFVIGDVGSKVAFAILGAIHLMPKFGAGSSWFLIFGIVGVVIGFKRWRAAGDGGALDSHGSARFSLPAEDRSTLGGDRGLIVGRASQKTGNGRLMRYDGPAHLLTIAPTRSGKGVGAIIPNLLTAERSILCIDPKGENARIAAPSRARLGPVHVLDPFEVSGRPGGAFNPLAGLDPESLDLAEDAALIAEALVYDPPRQVGEAHWNEEAKALIAGLILHIVTSAPPALRTLATLRDYLTRSSDRFLALLDDMQANTAAGGLVARAANRQLGKSEREASGVLSAAQRHTHFLDSPRMAKVTAHSDFVFADLKAHVATVFLVLPPDRLGTHARWLRLLVVQAINALARPGAATRQPVLLLLDEFAALGHLEPVERAFGLMAGYGVQLWAILQDLNQLKATYGQHAGTFLANAGLIQIFNVADVETASWVSRSMGSTTQTFTTTGTSRSQDPSRLLATHTDSTSLQLARRELMTPDEVMRMSVDNLLLLRPGSAPTLARKIRYYADAEFKGLLNA